MDKGPQQDPGEDPPPPEASSEQETELYDLKEQFEQQQVLIAQLKEMLRKTDQPNVTQEKMDRYASTLSKMTVRAKRSKLKRESSAGSTEKSDSKPVVDSPVNEKISLLRRQLEENKAKLAERGKNQRGIEEMVTQLKAQFDDSLQFINDTSSNFSNFEAKTDYNKESSSEDLYNVLVIKEKRITDLNAKVQKLEANVLDLQENLKEKDCVIDARTKAITLMTESLSKKGKNTQDTLDETKDQMRKMQEEFIKLENEMKARQVKLLDDLRLKNLEIAELQEINDNFKKVDVDMEYVDTEEINKLKEEIKCLTGKIEKLESSNSNLTVTNQELEESNKKIKENYKSQLEKLKESFETTNTELEGSTKKIKELENMIETFNENIPKKTEESDKSDEINKLKKDLDDLNKNMIKVKAEHKKKIKMLNKKIDSFKKIGDLNAHIVRISEENDTLKEKIAELEEEKGNYQLKMMDSFSKDSPSGENIEELEAKVNELSASLEEQTKKLEELESEKTSLKEQLELSNEKLQELFTLQNEKVTSEMSSIQFEELSEKLERDKKDILSAKDSLQNENEELFDKIETLNREKLEIQTKLEQYIHENMELIDKLEKLSAEKVSSAESIEIVDNLTHQEKLELEEFQKNLDPHSGKLKMSEEHLEGTPDLNDSVNQLTEETSELLQKIELFTVERREVMEKMESLTNENSQLNVKLKQVENNRDLLTETYEQLQSEKEELDNKIEALVKENAQLKNDVESVKNDYNITECEVLKKRLYDLEHEYSKLRDENENLRKELKIKAESIHEKSKLESELLEAKNKVQELNKKLLDSSEEISTYQSVIEDNKEEFIRSAVHLNELKEVINTKETEIKEHKEEINNLHSTINDFNKTINNLENENRSNKENTNKIESLEKQLDNLKEILNDNLKQIGEYENELEENANSQKELNQQLKELRNKNSELQNVLDEKNEKQNKIIINLNEEIEDLNRQIKSKDEMFHKVSSEMKDKFMLLQKKTDSNAESIEDMKEPLQKKIAELTAKNGALVEKMKKIAANLKKKTQICQDLEHELQSSREQWELEVNEKNAHIRETEEKIEALKLEADMYETEVKKLHQILNEKTQIDVPQAQAQAVEVRSEISLHEELSGSSIIPESFSKSDSNTSFSKIQELELIIETQENDISNYKERISVLEEMLAKMDETRETLEQKTNELGVQLQEKSHSFEEISKTEDILEEKLKSVSRHNEEIVKKLEEFSRENEILSSENDNLKDSIDRLKQKLNVAQERVNELLEIQQNAVVLEQELEKSRTHVNNLEQEIRKLDVDKVQFEESVRLDFEKLDTDWQVQFEVISKDKSELSVFCEKLNERISELTESERVLLEKVNELEFKLKKSYELQESSDQELTTQSEEIKNLKRKLDEKNGEIEHHLEELKNFESAKQDKSAEIDNLKSMNADLEARLDESVKELNSVKDILEQTHNELSQLRISNMELQNKLQLQPSTFEVQQPQKVQSLFAWPEQQGDPFSFVSGTQQNQPVESQQNPFMGQTQSVQEEHQHPLNIGDNSRKQLLEKIRTLEFMLKNVENERDEVLNQCSHLSNELMRFVYEKEGEQPAKSSFESADVASSLEPVTEPLCVKKQTYLCYPDDGKLEQKEVLPNIESQVLPEDFFKDTKETRKDLQQIEFTKTKDIVDNKVLFKEEPCHKKQAYLCHPEDGFNIEAEVQPSQYFDNKETKELLVQGKKPQLEQVNLDSFEEDDDGWGWNPEEAKLEEQYSKDYEANPLRKKIVELEDKLKAMEIERENKNKEYQELQVKSGKLIKKLKELKIKNEQLQGKKQENDDFFNLESAIQDELKMQVQALEKRITEVGSELSKEKNDKQALQKKVDQLSSTNQRITEMKEKQDIEMLMWQRKTEELKSKVDQFDWSSGGSPEKIKKPDQELEKVTENDIIKMQNTIQELNETITELTLDNEDLQALLEEQRTLRITAEKSKSVEPIPDNMKTETEYMEIVNQKQTLENEIYNIASEKTKLQDELNNIIKVNDEQLGKFRDLNEEKIQLEKIIKERDELINKLSANLEQVQTENDNLGKLIAEKSSNELYTQELLEKIHELEQNQHEKEILLQGKEGDANIILQEKEKLLNDLNEKESEIQNLKLSVDEKTTSLRNELENQMKNTEKLMQENENMSIQRKELEEQIQILLQQVQTRDLDFQAQVEKLNQDWQCVVDQRGSDVAESWKLHLESRETEFGQIKEELRKEINDLEEKCNGLVNENNELRKNVDTEIRNEVDRMSALQQQLHERQQVIHELSQSLSEKQLNLEKCELQILQLETNITDLQKTIEDKDIKINELHILVEAIQKQFDEKRIIVEEIVRKLEDTSTSPVLFDLESITQELNRQLCSGVTPEELSQLHKNINDKDAIISNMQNELASKIDEVNTYKLAVDNHSTLIEELKQQAENSNTDEKLNDLSTKLNEKETLLLKLQNELEAKLKELGDSRKTVEEYKLVSAEKEIQMTELQNRLSEKDEIISNISYQLQQTQSLKENENENVQNLQYSLQQYQVQYDELRSNFDEKSSLLDALNEELQKQHTLHLEREAEVKNLKMYVEELQRSHEFERNQLEKDKNDVIETQLQEINILKNQLGQTELHTDEIKTEKEMMQESVNYLHSQIEEQSKNMKDLVAQVESYKSLTEQLNHKLGEYQEMQKKFEEQNIILSEDDKQLIELKDIIEEQVMKIEDLKKKLYEKSNDYDSLIAEMDVRKEDLKVPDQALSTRPPMGQGQLIGPTCEDDLNEWVSRPELDIALYMLHQRDVRCEELTVELMQLLEERDTLQLRLSNALREKEEYKRVASETGKLADIPTRSDEGSPSKGAKPKGRVSEILLQSSGTELAKEAQEMSSKEPETQLEHKLSELRNMGYKRDKTLLDEQQRRLQQLSIMQEHMDEASRLPPEAAARLVDANYTLSRDVQSPSKVLLNWLWGRSTPKVNEL